MNASQNMEEQLWEYIDGLSTTSERSFIEALIASNQEWRIKYEELLQLNTSIQQNLELDEPSMRFTRNVMEEIAKHQIAPAAKSYINKKIIYGIGGFLLSLIAGFLIYAIAQIDWTSTGQSSIPIDFSKLNTGRIFNNNYVNAFMILNIVFGLMLLDRYLSQQRKDWKKQDI
jgi:hypothetical protein